MLGIFLYDIVFFGVPVMLLVAFGISLERYIAAKKQNKRVPGIFPPEEIKKRKILLIALSVVLGVLAAIVIGLLVLLSMAVAYM